MIVVPAVHPAREIVVTVDALRPGTVHRTATTLETVGGKAVNVARFVVAMGGPVRLVALADDELAAAFAAESSFAATAASGAPIVTVVPSPERSRVDLAIVDREGRATVVNGTALPPPGDAIAEVERRTADALGPGDVLVLAGSLPPGTTGLLGRLVRMGRDRGATVVVDASGTWLREALDAGPQVVKVNREEAAAADRVASGTAPFRGPDVVAITDGPAPIRAWIAGAEWRIAPPADLEIVSTHGAGDALTAGLALGLSEGRSALDALRLGVAMASARLRHLPFALDPRDVAEHEGAIRADAVE
jgi:1-phosphofructokinase